MRQQRRSTVLGRRYEGRRKGLGKQAGGGVELNCSRERIVSCTN